jgi:hypothetical protein
LQQGIRENIELSHNYLGYLVNSFMPATARPTSALEVRKIVYHVHRSAAVLLLLVRHQAGSRAAGMHGLSRDSLLQPRVSASALEGAQKSMQSLFCCKV